MSQLHSQHCLQPGLFTFYITQDKQHQNYHIIYPLKQSNSNYNIHGRKQQNITDATNQSKISKQNTDNQSNRSEKLNKFLSNCVGYRRNKSNDKLKIIMQQVSNSLQNNQNQGENRQKQKRIDKNQEQSSKQKIEKTLKTTKRQSKKLIKNEIIGTKKILEVKKLNIREDMIGQKIFKRRHTNKQQYLKINHFSQPKQKQNKIYLKLNTREAQLQQEQKLIEENINNINEYLKKYQQQNPANPKNKMIQLGLLSHLYPKLKKHHSQQLLIQPTKNTINVRSLVSKNSDNCYIVNMEKTDSHYKQQKYYNIQKEAYKLKNQINILQNLDKKIEVQTEKKKATIQLKINILQKKQDNIRLSLLSAQNCRQMIAINEMSCRNKQRRNNKLENKKKYINLPPLNLAERNIEKQNQINQIYYSVDHRQKKPLEINVGVFPNSRLIEGWQQRKKELIQKIKINDDKQVVKNRSQIKTQNSNKKGKPSQNNKQNKK